jgi:hypothetical protein
MGLNRQMRRQQERQKMREWVRDGTAERVRKLSVNGITDKDLDESYKNGYEAGYLYSATNFFKQMYAAIAKELIAAGNSTEEIVSFLHGVDHRFTVMFDSDDEIQDVYDLIGVRINVSKDSIDRINEVVINE